MQRYKNEEEVGHWECNSEEKRVFRLECNKIMETAYERNGMVVGSIVLCIP
jgi:hypothetical protein